VSEEDPIDLLILSVTKTSLRGVVQRCTEALKALEKQDYLVALGALVGVEQQIWHINARLMVLREVREIQTQKLK
jgi:hypothetical protein